MLGDTEVACLLATVVVSGSSAGISEIAVSTLSVLAGRNQPCGFLAASTWPVPASASTQARGLDARQLRYRSRRVADDHAAPGQLRAADGGGGDCGGSTHRLDCRDRARGGQHGPLRTEPSPHTSLLSFWGA